MSQGYRSLTGSEIQRLEKQHCSSDDWSKVLVADSFTPEKISMAHFSGDIRLGTFEKRVSFFGTIEKSVGIKNATIHNCTIGNNVYINNVKSYVANYHIDDDVVIENVDLLAVDGESSFGNGTEVSALNEGGGREVPIYDRLSAQTAYIVALYRHRPKVVARIKEMIAAYTESVRSSMGIIGRGARLINCRTIKNVKVGERCVIDGANRLENGSINSTEADPVYIGPGVFAENFIVCSGSKISDGTIIADCFVGQGCTLSKQYSAEHSLFFANCGGYHGEACAIFAGPYTVTHHKSTLLIAGLFSFLNAGSGSNQSNHMYKLGPLHQGIVERGSKTTSDSYILWPAKIGAFTVVIGRHYRNSDTSDLPFSYLIEHEDESILVPGINLRSVGTVRDARKWPKRDKRKDPDTLDLINFNLLSPYTIQKMVNGRELLATLRETSGETSDYYTYHSVKIRSGSLHRGIEFYQTGIDKFLGNSIISRLQDARFESNEELQKCLRPDTVIGKGKWVDLAGLIAPESLVSELLDTIENGTIESLQQLSDTFSSWHENYYVYEWTWAADRIEQELGKRLDTVTAGDIISFVQKWKESVIRLDRTLYADAQKEFRPTAQIGFGIDGDKTVRQEDFAEVRGVFEKNTTAKEILEHITAKSALGDTLIERLEKLK
jgi:hypothetical protein